MTDTLEDSCDVVPIVCWSRMQSEAGQGLHRILARKELERSACDGIFFWGVGNAPGTEPARLARAGTPVHAIFSVMKSKPKPQDANAGDLNLWRRYVDKFGDIQSLPSGALITSRSGARDRSHYALMCEAEHPVALGDHGPFNPKAFRNVGGRGAPVGASQVTALLRMSDPQAVGTDGGYRANLRATLTGGYWVKLVDPVRVSGQCAKALLAELEEVADMTAGDWRKLISRFREGAAPRSYQAGFFEHTPDRFAPRPALV